MLTGDNVCEWCRADYYRRTPGSTLRDGRQVLRCPRCNQPDHTCNEIAGRPFRMTWHRSMRSVGEAVHPRMPVVRCTFAIERMYIYTRVEAARQCMRRLHAQLFEATGVPASILFKTRPGGFAAET